MPSDQYANEMAWISSVITYLPDAYIVGVGLQPLNGEPTLAAQNTVLRDICRTNRFSYFDTFGVFGDVTNMTSRGFSDGSIHPSASGWKAWTDLLWNWLDLNP
jgi:hypothetical protein